jgi:hypothetical protein
MLDLPFDPRRSKLYGLLKYQKGFTGPHRITSKNTKHFIYSFSSDFQITLIYMVQVNALHPSSGFYHEDEGSMLF